MTMQVDLPPGSVVVVGPKGRLAIRVDATGRVQFHASNCDFIGPSGASVAHRAIVDERWQTRDENGRIISNDEDYTKADLPDWFSDLAADTPPVVEKRAWWKFWKRGLQS